MLFEYKAMNAAGKKVAAVVDAENRKAALSRLKAQGLMVTEIGERKGAAASGARPSSSGISFFSGVPGKDVALMTKQLSSLVRANIPLVEALSAVADQTENRILGNILSQIKQNVNEGLSLAKAMAMHPKVFDNIYVSMIESGESSGTLSFVFGRLAELKEAQMRLKSKVVAATMYPALMFTVSFALMLAIFTFLIPKMTKIFQSSKRPVPFITQVLIYVSDFVVHWWFLIIGGMIGGFIGFQTYIATPVGKEWWDGFKMRLPVLGNVFRLVAVTRFASTMATLLASGVPILTCLQIAKNIVDNAVLAKAIESAKENITEGQSIAEPLRKSGQFPPMMIHMVATGEKTGDLPGMLNSIASTYEEQVNTSISAFTSLLEPIMIVFMGGVVGLVVVAVMLPMLEMMNITQR
jgi:general secretion pathway protein F